MRVSRLLWPHPGRSEPGRRAAGPPGLQSSAGCLRAILPTVRAAGNLEIFSGVQRKRKRTFCEGGYFLS